MRRAHISSTSLLLKSCRFASCFDGAFLPDDDSRREGCVYFADARRVPLNAVHTVLKKEGKEGRSMVKFPLRERTAFS